MSRTVEPEKLVGVVVGMPIILGLDIITLPLNAFIGFFINSDPKCAK